MPSGETTAPPTRVMPMSARPSSSRVPQGAGGSGLDGSKLLSDDADNGCNAMVRRVLKPSAIAAAARVKPRSIQRVVQ